MLNKIGHRVAGFDLDAAEQAGDLIGSEAQERPGYANTMIAGIVLARHATLATRNAQHFHDDSLPLVNPWSG